MTCINIELLDRQIRTFGFDETIKISEKSIMIIGLQGILATEICKNLILSNINKLYLYDINIITAKDIETNYFYNNYIGERRDKILQQKLLEFYPDLSITITDIYTCQQDITIIINQDLDYILELSKYCRINNSQLIVLFSGGISGVIFVDAGINHFTISNIKDPIQLISLDNNGIIICSQNHNLQSNDLIKLTNLKGINYEQFNKEWKIEVINKTIFKLKHFTYSNPFKILNGTIIYIPQKTIIKHQSFEDQINNKKLNPLLDNKYAHDLINTYIKLYNKRLIDKMPFIWSEENDVFMNINNIDLKEQARIMNYEIIPVASLMASLIANEVLKLASNTYNIIDQWFTWTDTNLIPFTKPEKYNTNFIYNILYGEDYEKKMLNTNIMIIGAGATGYEHLKNLAYLKIGININKIVIVDYDTIDKSNIKQNFLFTENDIYNLKTETIKNKINSLQPDSNIVVSNTDITKSFDDIYNSFSNADQLKLCVFSGVDNITTRKFIDDKCFKYNIPLFESGTDGLKGHVQPIIPFITETYSASVDPEYDITYPECVIANFPNDINHTIIWAIEKFNFFTQAPLMLNNYLNENNYLENISDKNNTILNIYKLLVKYPLEYNSTNIANLNLAVKYSIDLFIKLYYIDIIKLIKLYDHDHEISPGVLFWSGSKKIPTPIKIDYTNKLHIDFIFTTIFLLLDIFNSKPKIDIDYINISIKTYIQTIDYNNLIDEIIDISNKDFNNFKHNKYISINLDYNNCKHITWITSASNLRAENYCIQSTDNFTVKGIVGKIIPKVVTISSIVSALSIIEFLKYLLNNKYNIYKSNFINLGEPIIINSQTIDAPVIDIGGIKFSSWYKFEYNENSKLEEFKNYYEKIFDTIINMIVYDTTILYADFIKDKLDKYLIDIIQSLNSTSENIITFILLSEDTSKDLPMININLNKIS